VHTTLDGRDTSRVTQQLNSTAHRVDRENHVIDWNGTRNDCALRRDGTAATGEASKGSKVTRIHHYAGVSLRCRRGEIEPEPDREK
jgi:hypothetical protein